MTVPVCTLLPVGLDEALRAIEDRRFISACAPGLFFHPVDGDGVLRGHHTHVEGGHSSTYQLTARVIEVGVDEHRVRYELHAREVPGSSLAALTVDAELASAEHQTTLTLVPTLALVGVHGGHSYRQLETTVVKALTLLGERVAERLRDPRVVAEFASPRAACGPGDRIVAPEDDSMETVDGRRVLRLHDKKRITLVMAATTVLLSLVAYVVRRRSCGTTKPSSRLRASSEVS